MRPLLVMLGLLLLTGATPVRAETVTIPAMKDNTLYEDPTGAVSNGAGPGIFAGNTAAGRIRRAVIAFDVAGAVPAGSTIQSVQLRLHMSMTIVGDKPVSLHRALADWGEGASNAGVLGGAGAPSTPGDATWIHTFYDTQFWTTPGGDFTAVSSATAAVDDVGYYTWGSTPEMVTDVQAWLDAPPENFGWVVIGDETTVPSAKRFDSREHDNADFRPVLDVEFQPVVVPVEEASWSRVKGLHR